MQMESGSMAILLVEDEKNDRQAFVEYAESCSDIVFVGATDSGEDAFEIVKNAQPEAVILDLELNFGNGSWSGIDFLNELQTLNLPQSPIIVVTTNTPSQIVHSLIRGKGVAFIFYKLQPGYEPKKVIDFLLLVRNPAFIKSSNVSKQSVLTSSPRKDSKEDTITEKIEAELDMLGVSRKYVGRNYIAEALKLSFAKGGEATSSLIREVADNEQKEYSSVVRAMETAIKNTWYDNKEEAEKHYTVRVDKRRGYPTPSDFVHFYKEKLQKLYV